MLQNRVREYSVSTGSGTFNLDGRVDSTYEDFVSAFGDGNPCFYTIVNMDALEWEIGRGVCHIGSPNTLTRTTVFESSSGGSPVSFSAGQKQVFCGIPQQFFAVTPTAGYTPRSDATTGKIANGWLKNTIGYDYYKVITYASSIAIDMNNGAHQFITLTGNPTLTLANSSSSGDFFTLALKQDATGGRTVTWFAGITWPGGSPVQPTTTANSITYFDFIRMADGTIYYRPIVSSGGGGGGGVSGPGSTNIDAVAVWDNITGTLLRNSLVNIHSSANDKLEYLASFSNIYNLTDGVDLTGAHSDQLLPISDGGFNSAWSSTNGINMWDDVNVLVPSGINLSISITNGSFTGSAPIYFGLGPLAYVPTTCTVKLYTSATVGTTALQAVITQPSIGSSVCFQSASTTVPVNAGGTLSFTMSAVNPALLSQDFRLTLSGNLTTQIHIYGIEVDFGTSGGVLVVDMNKADKFTYTMSASRNVEFDNYSIGQRVILDVTQDSTGGFKPTFVNCIIYWNHDHEPWFRSPANTWIVIELLCESIDIYGRPIFKELTRRATVRYDDRNYRIGTNNQDVSGGTIGLNLDTYLLTADTTLPTPVAKDYGKKVTLINSGTGKITISGVFYSNWFKNSGGSWTTETSWVLPIPYDSVTLIASTVGWVVVEDNRRMVWSSVVLTTTQTVPVGVNFIESNSSGNITLTLLTTGAAKNQTMVVKNINTGTTTVTPVEGSSITVGAGKAVTLIYDGTTWQVVGDYTPAINGTTLGSKALAATADSITGIASTDVAFSNGVVIPAGTLVAGSIVKFRASGTFSVTTSGDVVSLGLFISSRLFSCTNFSFIHASTTSGYWQCDGEIIVGSTGSSGVIQSCGRATLDQVGAQSKISSNARAGVINTTISNTIKVYMEMDSSVTADLRSLSLTLG